LVPFGSLIWSFPIRMSAETQAISAFHMLRIPFAHVRQRANLTPWHASHANIAAVTDEVEVKRKVAVRKERALAS
jgi:hypothetical protein